MTRVALLLLVVLLVACGRKSQTVLVDPALSILVPPDTVYLAGIRMGHLRETPFYKRYVEQRRLAQIDEFTRNTGLDPRKDIWEYLVAGDGVGFVVMARGKFSEMGLEPKLEREGARRFNYKGQTLLGDEQWAVAFTNSTTAIAGNTRSVQRVLDVRNQGTGMPATLKSAVDAVGVENQVWFAANTAGLVPDFGGGNLGNLGNIARYVGSVRGKFDLRSGLIGSTDLIAQSDPDTKRLGDAVRGLLGFARLGLRNDAEMQRMFDDVSVQQTGRTVSVGLKLEDASLDRLMTMLTTTR